MIEVKEVNKKIKDVTILNNIDISIQKNKCVGFVGHNGSGKTMLLKAICGFTKVDTGYILVNGETISFGKSYIKDAGIIIEHPPFINYISAMDNLRILSSIKKTIGDVEIEETLKKLGLFKNKDQKVKSFSLGMKQKLRIAQAIMEDPRILILDEPFNGLDKDSVEKVKDLLLEFKRKGSTILLTSHDERHIDALCDTVYMLDGGNIIE